MPILVWAAAIFALSSIPHLGTDLGVWDLVLRKLAHAAEFAVLGALLARALASSATAVLVGVAYAVTDEVHQSFVAGRQGALRDVLVDAVGVGLGVLFWRQLASRRLSA